MHCQRGKWRGERERGTQKLTVIRQSMEIQRLKPHRLVHKEGKPVFSVFLASFSRLQSDNFLTFHFVS